MWGAGRGQCMQQREPCNGYARSLQRRSRRVEMSCKREHLVTRRTHTCGHDLHVMSSVKEEC